MRWRSPSRKERGRNGAKRSDWVAGEKARGGGEDGGEGEKVRRRKREAMLIPRHVIW